MKIPIQKLNFRLFLTLSGLIMITLYSCQEDDDTPAPVINMFSPISGIATNSDRQGTVVTVSGINFNSSISSNHLTFNGIEANILSASNEELVALVPEGATSGKLKVIVNNKTGTSQTDFTVIPPVIISGFSPAFGAPTRRITINGNNFGATSDDNEVKFNGVMATIISVSTTQLVVAVPESTSGKISVTVNGITAISESDFTIIQRPSISSFTPTTGVGGTTVTIAGEHFGVSIDLNTVKFGEQAAIISEASSTKLTVTVPNGVGTGKISVTVYEVTTTTVNSFVVPNSPEISSFSPKQGTIGTKVLITGNNFNSNIRDNLVKFNNAIATIISASSTSLEVSVPSDATTGKVSVTVNELTTTSEDDFTVLLSPVINSFSPSSGTANTSVTIEGDNFSDNPLDNTVKFNNTAATIISVSKNRLVVKAPTGVTTGKISVTVKGVTTFSEDDFTLASGPVITSVNTNYEYIGAIIQINGSNFSPTPEDNLVKFNGVNATVTSATTTALRVRVPENASDGKISVTVNSLTTYSPNNFGVRLPAIFLNHQFYAIPGQMLFLTELALLEADIFFPEQFEIYINSRLCGTLYLNPSPTQPAPPVPFDYSITLPQSVTSGKVTVVRFRDGAIVAEWGSDLEILNTYPMREINASYYFNNGFGTFARFSELPWLETIGYLNHPYENHSLPTFTANRFGKSNAALIFNGNQAGSTATDRLSGKPWTVSFWMSYGALANNILCNGGISSQINKIGVDIAIVQRNDEPGADMNLKVTVDDNDFAPGTAVAELTDYKNDPAFLPLAGTSNAWINLTLSYDGTIFRIYKNGVKIIEKTITGNKGNGLGPLLRIGNANGFYYTGKMDDLFTYNVALTESEVEQLYLQTQTKY